MLAIRTSAATRLALLATSIAVALLLAACGGSGDPAEPVSGGGTSVDSGAARSGERLEIPDAGEALRWGAGSDAVLLVHGAAFDAASWEPQAVALAEAGHLVVALEQNDPDSILAGLTYLRNAGSARKVALIGGSAGADSALQALSSMPAAADQLITLSVNSTAADLGPAPKLFIASAEEPLAHLSEELAETAEGTDNEALILPGSAHAQNIFDTDQGPPALEAIVTRLAS